MRGKVYTNDKANVILEYGFLNENFDEKLGLGERLVRVTNGTVNCDVREIYFDEFHINSLDIFFNKRGTLQLESEKNNITSFFLLRGNWTPSYAIFNGGLETLPNQHNIVYGVPYQHLSEFYSSDDSIQVIQLSISPDEFLKFLPMNHELFDKFKNNIVNKKPCYLNKNNQFISYEMSQILLEIVNCNRIGIMKRLFYRAKILDLLVLQMEQFIRNGESKPFLLNQRQTACIFGVKEFMEKNINSPLSLSELARLVGTNEYVLKKGFKEIFGSSVFNYWNNLKMKQAREMILETDKSITEISFYLGYSNARHFSTAFKRKFGEKPSDLRK